MKLLIIYNKVWSYREKIFEILNQEFDLTVGYSDPSFKNKIFKFKTVYMPVKQIGPFEIHRSNIHNMCKSYDVVIAISNIRWISLVGLVFKKRNYRLGFWGIGVTASYENKFDSKSTWDKLRFYIANKSDFTIFYSSYPIQKYLNGGVSKEKLFVANNTTEVKTIIEINDDNKINFMFLGTLYLQKGLEELLQAYNNLYLKRKDIPKLLIVGDGPEKQNILNFIVENQLDDKVILYGSIYDAEELSKVFAMSIACISPCQAGLSVLNSMGNRTAFVTKEDAITGGEIFNIKNKINGIVYGREESLTEVLNWILDNTDKVKELNNKAYNYYIENRTPEMMANQISIAVKYSLNQ